MTSLNNVARAAVLRARRVYYRYRGIDLMSRALQTAVLFIARFARIRSVIYGRK